MKKPFAILLFALASLAMPVAQAADPGGVVNRASPYSVSETLDRLEAVLKAKGVKIFTRIDHAAEAQGAGLALRPSQLLIFGNPKAGTPLMQAAPAMGLDLPMKALAWQDEQGRVQIIWNDPGYLAGRYGLAAEQAGSLAAIGKLIDAALKQP